MTAEREIQKNTSQPKIFIISICFRHIKKKEVKKQN